MSFGSWLDVAVPHLAEPLFGPRDVSRLRGLAGWLPGGCQAILEVRLGGALPAVDLSVQLDRPSQALRAAELPLPEHLRGFLSRWAGQDATLAPVSRVWLEFDLRDDGQVLPVPAVAARLEEKVEFGWLSELLWPALRGQALTGQERETARRCWDAMPASAGLLYAFGLLSREGQPLRMELFGLSSPGSVVEYLRRLSPPHAEATGSLAEIFEGVERLHLSFDLGPRILPRVGIEGSFLRRPEREPRWGRLLDRLVEAGLAEANRRDALLAWPGSDSFWTAAQGWPLAEAGIGTRLVRGVSHVKVVCGPGIEPQAKAYLTLVPWDRGSAGAAASSMARSSALAT